MKLSSRVVVSASLVLFFMGCGGQSTSGEGDGKTGGSGGSAPSGGVMSCANAIVTSPTNNYAFSSILSFQSINVKPDSELTFDWSGVTRDLLGHDIDLLTEVDAVDLALWSLTPEELATEIQRAHIDSADVRMVTWFRPENRRTEASLFEFGAPDPGPPDQILRYVDAEAYPPPDHTYTLMLRTGEQIDTGYRMIQAFTLDHLSTNTLVELTDTSTFVEFTVDIASRRPTAIPAGRADITIDWSDIDRNAIGQEASPELITEVVVARYDESAVELEARFFDLELIATDIWRGNAPPDMTMELSSLTNVDGERFAGIDGNGTWLVALLCSSCQNPAPWYLSVLTPCREGG